MRLDVAKSTGLFLAAAVVMASLLCVAEAVEGGLAGENADFGKDISLEGTSPGPHHFFMTKRERRDYRRYMRKDPQGREEFAEIRATADKALDELPQTPTGNWIDEVLWHRQGMALATAYLVTDEERYLKRASEMMVRCANTWMERNTPLEGRQQRGRGNSWIWGPGGGQLWPVKMKDGSTEWCNWDMTWVVLAYDLLAGEMPQEDEKVVRAFIKNACDGLVEWKHVNPPRIPGQGEGGNMAAQTIGHWSVYGFAIGYDAFTDWCISHDGRGSGMRDRGGLLEIIQGFRDNAIQGEAPGYWWYIGDGILSLAHAAVRAKDIDLWNMAGDEGMTFRGVIDGKIAIAYPVEATEDGGLAVRCPHWGEGGWDWLVHGSDPGAWLPGHRCASSRWEPILRGAYETIEDEGYGWFLSLLPQTAQRSSHGLPVEYSGFEPPKAPSRVFPNAGMAMLRSDETPGYWMGRGMAMMVRGGEPMRSAPGDSFSIRLHGAGKLLYPDWNTATYEDYTQVGWARAGIRRSTVMIDNKECWRHRTIWRRKSYPEVKYLSMRGSRYGNDRSERAFMMTAEYLLDVFDLTVEQKYVPEMEFLGRPTRHVQYRDWSGASLYDEDGKLPDTFTFDWVLNAAGRALPAQWWRYEPSRRFSLEGWPNRYIEDEMRSDMGDAPVRIDYTQGDAAVRMWMLGDRETTVFTARPPSPTHLAVVRRKGKEATFAALHEPYSDRPAVRELSYLRKPAAGDDPRVVAVKVASRDYVDRVYMTLGLDGVRGTEGSEADMLKTGKEEIRNITLDWLFKKDPEEAGQNEGWFETDHDRSDWREVDAGVNWQEFEKGYYGAAWYAKTVAPAEPPPGRKVYLLFELFEGVDEDCWVYIDGKKVYERVAEVLGDLWDKPILLDVTDAWRPGQEHQLVVKVRKMKYQTGIYWPVSLMVEAAPGQEAGPPPLVTVASPNDENEYITFREEAFLRDSGDTFTARGEIKRLCVWAPAIPLEDGFMLNGEEAPYRTVSGYLLYGDAREPRPEPRLIIEGVRPLLPKVFAGRAEPFGVKVWNFTGADVQNLRLQLTCKDRLALSEPVVIKQLLNGASIRPEFIVRFPAALAGEEVTCRIQATYEAAGAVREAASAPRRVAVCFPADVEFPQGYVNIDAENGGKLIARVWNRSDRKLSGAVIVEGAPELSGLPLAQGFAGLKPGRATDLLFNLKALGPDSGSVVPLKVSVRVPAEGGREHTVLSKRLEVAVGVVISEVPATYRIPYYDHTAGMPGKLRPRSEWTEVNLDHFLVRAPAYTIKIDRSSGMSRWVIDPTGALRTSWAGYPWGKVRGEKAGLRPQPALPPLVRLEGFDWTSKAEFIGLDRDDEGNPVLKFESGSQEEEPGTLLYTFRPGSVEVNAAVSADFFDLPGTGSVLEATEKSFGFAEPDVWPLERNSMPE